MMNSSKRHKICINFHDNKGHLLKNYDDEISIDELKTMANRIIDRVNKFIDASSFVRYMIIQKTFNTNQIGIKMVLKKYNDNLMLFIWKDIDTDVTVFCYGLVTGPIYHLGPSQRLTDIYDNTLWTFDIDSFSQIYKEVGEQIHKTVNESLHPASYLIGLGGESGYYAKVNKKKFKEINLFTNSKTIHDDCLYSNQHSELVDYDMFELNDHYRSVDTVLIINISRHGLKKRLAEQVNKLDFKQIVYIACSNVAISNDSSYLSNYKIVDKHDLREDRYIITFQKI